LLQCHFCLSSRAEFASIPTSGSDWAARASALMGRFWLGERFGGHRWLGLATLIGGCLLISVAK